MLIRHAFGGGDHHQFFVSGIPGDQELVGIAPAKCVAKHPSVYRDFMAGLAKGPEVVRDHHGTAVSLIAENYGFDPRFRMSDVRSSLEGNGAVALYQRPHEPQSSGPPGGLDVRKGDLKRKPPVRELFTNDYLAP